MIDRRIMLLLAFCNFIVVSLCLTVIVKDRFRQSTFQAEISVIKSSKDSLAKVNAKLEERERALEQKTEDLQSQINQSTQTIQTLKTKRNEKINQLDTMYVDGLVRFFTEFETTDSTGR